MPKPYAINYNMIFMYVLRAIEKLVIMKNARAKCTMPNFANVYIDH